MKLDISEHDNFIYLTFSLTLLLLATACAQQFFDSTMQRLMQSATVVTLFIAVWGVKNNHFIFRRGLIFPLLIVVNTGINLWLESAHLEYVHLGLLLIFFSITAMKTTRQVIFTGAIDSNKILGAVCLYMLLGLILAVIYTITELANPGSFNGIVPGSSWFELLPTFVYFSFVTITTLGYGDISPVLPLPQFLVYFEAMLGQFYIAILVASLVGARMSTIEKDQQTK